MQFVEVFGVRQIVSGPRALREQPEDFQLLLRSHLDGYRSTLLFHRTGNSALLRGPQQQLPIGVKRHTYARSLLEFDLQLPECRCIRKRITGLLDLTQLRTDNAFLIVIITGH